MRVGQKDEIQCGGLHRQRNIDVNILSLFHAEVHDPFYAADLNERAAARNLMRRAVKPELHSAKLPFLRSYSPVPYYPKSRFSSSEIFPREARGMPA